MEIFSTKVKTNLDGVLQTTQMVNGIMMTGDNAANQILVELYRGFDRIDIAPDTKIVGYFIRSDGQTLEVDGEVEDNMAKVVIPEAAYQISGNMSIAVRLFDNSEEKHIETRKYSVTTITRKYEETVVTRKYQKITVIRRYYDPDLAVWVELADGEEAPDGYEVEEYQTAEWVKLEDGEDPPAGAEVQITTNHVTVILEDGIEPPPGVEVDTIETKEWIVLKDDEEPPAGAEVVTTTQTVITWGTKLVIASLSCYVRITETDSIIDVYHHIPDVQELLSYIDALDAKRAAIESAEAIRVSNENTRISNETDRQSNYTTKMTEWTQAEVTRAQTFTTNESARQTAFQTVEDQRQSAELVRIQNENDRVSAETTRQANESNRQTNEGTRQHQESLRQAAQQSRNEKIDNMTVEAQELNPYDSPTATITEVNGHKHIVFGLAPGDPFVIAKIFSSVSDMTLYAGEDLRQGQFVLISSDTEDPDNAKMYVVATAKPVSATNTFTFVTDLSGSQGIQGPRGYTGNGISSTYLDPTNYTLTVTFTDGDSYTTESIRGMTGATGNGIAGVAMNSEFKLVIAFTDGTTYTTDRPIRGIDGVKGDTGNGIASATMGSDYKLTITMTDGSTFVSPSLKGEPGAGGTNFTYDSTDKSLVVEFY